MKKKLGLITAAALLLANATASAVPSPPCDTSDATFRGQDADACAGPIGGNDDAAAVGSAFGGSWNLLSRDNIGGGDTVNTWLGIRWTLSALDGDDITGDWQLTWEEVADPGLPLIMDLVLSVKAGNDFSLFRFNEELFEVDPNTGTGTYRITWCGNNPNRCVIPGLSHVTVYGSNPDYPPPPPPDVPEPGTLALLGLGLLGLGASRLKK